MPSKDTGTISIRMKNRDIEAIYRHAEERDTTVGMIVKDLLKRELNGDIDAFKKYEKACRDRDRDPRYTLELITEQIIEP